MKTKKATPDTKTALANGAPTEPIQASFAEVVSLIEQARNRAYRAVNTELVVLYWQIGKYISRKLDAAEWGEGVVDHLAQHLKRTLPGLRGDEKVSSLLTQSPWTHNLIILGQSRRRRSSGLLAVWCMRSRVGTVGRGRTQDGTRCCGTRYVEECRPRIACLEPPS